MKTEIQNMITHFWCKAQSEKLYCSNWELLKFEVAQYMRGYGTHIAKARRLEEETVVSKIVSLCQQPPGSLSEAEKLS